MLNTLLILQYSFLNGYLLHRLLLKEKTSDFVERIISALFLSWCLNSLTIYTLVRVFAMPFTKLSVIVVSASLTVFLFITGFFFHSDRNHVLVMERRNPLARLWKGFLRFSRNGKNYNNKR